MDLPKRKHPRLKNYDYSQNGCYHIIICVKNSHTRPTVSDCVRIVKSIFTRKCNAMDGTAGRTIFQTSFYDEVIGSLSFYEQVWRYIDENPMKWLITHHKI